MQVTDKVRRLKQFLEATIEETKKQELTGQSVGVEFSFGSAKGDVSASEATAFMQALLRAVSAFDEDIVAQMSFNMQIVHPAQEAIGTAVQGRMKTLIDLEANAAKLVVAK